MSLQRQSNGVTQGLSHPTENQSRPSATLIERGLGGITVAQQPPQHHTSVAPGATSLPAASPPNDLATASNDIAKKSAYKKLTGSLGHAGGKAWRMFAGDQRELEPEPEGKNYWVGNGMSQKPAFRVLDDGQVISGHIRAVARQFEVPPVPQVNRSKPAKDCHRPTIKEYYGKREPAPVATNTGDSVTASNSQPRTAEQERNISHV